MATTDDSLLQSSVEIFNKPHLLTLYWSHLTWEHTGRSKGSDSPSSEPFLGNECTRQKIREIIGIKPLTVPPKPSRLGFKKTYQVNHASPLCIEMQPLGPIGFAIYVLAYSSKHRWRHKQINFTCKDSQLCQQWIKKIKELLTSPALKRPQKLIVYVNPFSGKKRAPKVYREKVQPLFDLAEIQTEVVETQRANQAFEEVGEKRDLSKVDGVVCVGGDGMFAELLNGLLTRAARESETQQTPDHIPVTPDIRIGIIPAGSTDAIVYTTTGINDPVTSALHIILGESLGIDVCSISQNNQFLKYSVANLSYGYLGDVVKDSEKNRWMGPKRYDWSGFKKFVGNNAYDGEISYKLSTDPTDPKDGTRCRARCEVCSSAARRKDEGSLEDFNCDTGDLGVISPANDGWTTIRGRFISINHVTMPCCCDMSPSGLSPTCHLGDGCADLILTYECSRFNFLRYLTSVASKSLDGFGFDFVKVFRVKEFKFRALGGNEDDEHGETRLSVQRQNQHRKLKSKHSENSVWNCDGEIIDNPCIDVKVHCQGIKLFARGVEEKDSQSSCSSCCSSGEEL